jgi:hypothetical protein
MRPSLLCLLSFPISLVRSVRPRQSASINTGQFSLWTVSNDTSINGRTIAENSSTDDGPTNIILAAAGSADMQILGFLLDQSTPPTPAMTYFLVNQPMRSRGSEYDGWVVEKANASGIVAPQVVPAGGTTGWSFSNATTTNGTVVRELGFGAGGKKAGFYGECAIRIERR